MQGISQKLHILIRQLNPTFIMTETVFTGSTSVYFGKIIEKRAFACLPVVHNYYTSANKFYFTFCSEILTGQAYFFINIMECKICSHNVFSS